MYSTGIAYLLWALSGFGALGLHRYYLGKIPSGILWTCTAGFFGIGSIYDLFTLPSQVRHANIEKAIRDGRFNPNINISLNGQPMRVVNDGQAHVVPARENPEQAVLRAAKANKGIITASELALSANMSIEDAKKALDKMVSKGHAELRVRQSGSLVYAIPDIMDSDEPLVD